MILEYLYLGGVLMWPLLLLALTATALGLERLVYFLLSYVPFPDLQELAKVLKGSPKRTGKASKVGVEKALDSVFDSASGARISFCPWPPPLRRLRLTNSAWYQITQTYMQHWHSPKSRAAALERNGAALIARMEKRIDILQTIALLSPLLGLLGTIMGMMQSFQAIQDSGGQAGIAQVAGGIWVAMLSTAFGLGISIPTHLIYNTFHSLVNARIRQMNGIILYLDEQMHLQRVRRRA